MQGVPKEAEGATFRESILIGATDLTNMEITKRIDALRDQYRGNQYHIVLKYGLYHFPYYFRNCNHFSNDVCKTLLGVSIPSYINRCAYLASWFSCLFPQNTVESEEEHKVRFAGQGNRLTVAERRTDSAPLDATKQRELRLKALGVL